MIDYKSLLHGLTMITIDYKLLLYEPIIFFLPFTVCYEDNCDQNDGIICDL